MTEGVGCFADGLYMTVQDLRLAEGRRQFKKKEDWVGVSAKRSALQVACTRELFVKFADFSTSARCNASEEAYNNSALVQGQVLPPSDIEAGPADRCAMPSWPTPPDHGYKSVGAGETWIAGTGLWRPQIWPRTRCKSRDRRLRLVHLRADSVRPRGAAASSSGGGLISTVPTSQGSWRIPT